MKTTSQIIARALIETCRSLPESDMPSIVDAALHLLEVEGLGKEMRTFSRTVRDVLKKEFGVTDAQLLTPTGDASGTENAIVQTLSTVLGKSVDLKVSKDSQLIGGALLNVGDERFDASIRGVLEHLKQHLTMGPSLVS